jgi:uncharacterized protein YjbI with pentapeptide repeats
MTRCTSFHGCYLEAMPDSVTGECILHDPRPEKDPSLFASTLDAYLDHPPMQCWDIVCPISLSVYERQFSNRVVLHNATFLRDVDFGDCIFEAGADFSRAKFQSRASFMNSSFTEDCYFTCTAFRQPANFESATLIGEASFYAARFDDECSFAHSRFESSSNFKTADFGAGAFFRQTVFGQTAFWHAHFRDRAEFEEAVFKGDVDFSEAKFFNGVSFVEASFEGQATSFRGASIIAPALFSSLRPDEKGAVFGTGEVDFGSVTVSPPEGLIFRNCNLRTARFLDVNVRKAEFTDVRWDFRDGRRRVYDEIAPTEKRHFGRVEQLCRDIKKNHEDRGDYARAGDFHYAEKEMQRQNPETGATHRFFLNIYRVISGYGEKYILPVIWAGALLVIGSILLLVIGVRWAPNGAFLSWKYPSDWGWALHYALGLMTLQRPTHLQPVGAAIPLATAVSLFGPLLLGFFALALRQHLRR